MDTGSIVVAFISVTLVVMLGGLFIWLTSGVIDPGPAMFLMGVVAVLLFFAFGWIVIIAIGLICSIIAGFLFTGGD
jgi:hypothetical protein